MYFIRFAIPLITIKKKIDAMLHTRAFDNSALLCVIFR